MLGKGSRHAEECLAGGFIGAGWFGDTDLTGRLPDDWRTFNREFIPLYLANHPDKTKVGAGLACGQLWTVCKGLQRGDIVLCPDGSGSYRVAEVKGDYAFAPGSEIPHRRAVEWLNVSIPRSEMTEALQNSAGSIGTVCNITQYSSEIEQLIGNIRGALPKLVATDPDIEDVAAFAMEKHLEAFLVSNWNQTHLSQEFEIFQEDGELVGQQYSTDTGPIDILAVSKDKKRLLVVELKRGRASDVVVGQILRYMGYIQGVVAEPHQTVEGVVIALEDDPKLKWALSAVPSVSFYRYQVSFKLIPGGQS